MTFSRKITCPYCGASDRIPAEDFNLQLVCRKCQRALFAARPAELDTAALRELLANSEIPVLVDFWAPWCGPCKAMAPAFEQAARQLEERVKFAKVNTDEEQEISQELGIRSIPTMILFSGGEEIARHSGALSAGEIESWATQQAGGPAEA